MKHRLPKLPYYISGIYLLWSVFVFFSTLGKNGHEWWPLFLYFIIWPLSLVFEFLDDTILDFFTSKQTSEWIWVANDYIMGFFYIVGGTLWVWFLGRIA